jgi:predicted nucleic acid-binding protein
VPFYQFDASGIVKRYVNETGSDRVRALVDPAAGNVVSISDITRAEVASAVSRRAREGSITPDESVRLIGTFEAHCASQFRVVPVERVVVDLAVDLIQRHPLRAYDAIQLAAAVLVNRSLVVHGLPTLVFVSADDTLRVAAQAEALPVENPNSYP